MVPVVVSEDKAMHSLVLMLCFYVSQSYGMERVVANKGVFPSRCLYLVISPLGRESQLTVTKTTVGKHEIFIRSVFVNNHMFC